MMTLHEQALGLAKTLLTAESGLLSVLMQMQGVSEFVKLGYTGMFEYCVRGLRLSEAQGSYFVRVAAKSREVPELKAAIDNGELSLSQARRIVSVITVENKAEWIEKAATLKQRDLEKEVAQVNPKAVIREKIRPVAKALNELRVGLTDEQEGLLKQAQDIWSQQTGKAAGLQETLEAALRVFLEKKSPVEKAKRASLRKAKPAPAPKVGRHPIAAPIKHQVHLRDGFQCTETTPQGQRCEQRRWLQLHHVLPVALGGANTVSNLTTLCSGHHRGHHNGIASSLRSSQRRVGRQ